MPNQVSGSRCLLCGRQGVCDERFCSECFQLIPNGNGVPDSLRVTVNGPHKGGSGALRWILIIGIVLALLAGIYYGRNITSQDEKQIDHPKNYQDKKDQANDKTDPEGTKSSKKTDTQTESASTQANKPPLSNPGTETASEKKAESIRQSTSAQPDSNTSDKTDNSGGTATDKTRTVEVKGLTTGAKDQDLTSTGSQGSTVNETTDKPGDTIPSQESSNNNE